MKKAIVLILVLLCLLGGCNKTIDPSSDKTEVYNSVIEAVTGTSDYLTSSSNYSISLAVNKISDGEYRYDVIVDKPLIGMYNVSMLAVVQDSEGNFLTDKLCPSLGILEDERYCLIPNQVDTEKGFPEGLIISGTTDLKEFKVMVMVSWYGSSKLIERREYLTLSGKYE